MLFTRDFEESALHDEEDCTKGKPDYATLSSTWIGYDKAFVMEGDSDEAKNNQEVSGFGRWWITAVGRFRRAEGDQRFGHLACCKYRFALIKIEKSESCDNTTNKPLLNWLTTFNSLILISEFHDRTTAPCQNY